MPLSRGQARVLFLSDTHLGLDLPRRPRVVRRRRGPELFAAYERALAPAARREVDLVVHGGDILYRSRVPPGLVERAFAPLKAIADRGVPVCVVPGNHERSRIPHPLLATHPGIHVFDRPRTVSLAVGGLTLALAGFTGLMGMLFALRGFQKNLQLLKEKIKEGVFPTEEFITLTGIFAAAILLLTPGFITDLLGFALFIPVIRSTLGRFIIRMTRTNFKELYEYLKLYDY